MFDLETLNGESSDFWLNKAEVTRFAILEELVEVDENDKIRHFIT